MIIFADQIAPVDPLAQNLAQRLKGPTELHIFGTDELGRDIFSRVVHGARISLPASFFVVAVSLVMGSLLGAAAGFTTFAGLLATGFLTAAFFGEDFFGAGFVLRAAGAAFLFAILTGLAGFFWAFLGFAAFGAGFFAFGVFALFFLLTCRAPCGLKEYQPAFPFDPRDADDFPVTGRAGIT